jgi:hypothetical protein
LFSDDALTLVHQVSRGLPRAGDNLAVRSSLVAAFADNKATVDESSARAAVTEVTTELPSPERRPVDHHAITNGHHGDNTTTN